MSSKRGEKADTSNRNRSTESHVGSWPLFWTILLWVVLALAVFTVLGWLWGEGPSWSWQRWLTNWRSAGADAGPLEVVKVSLTTIGGIGGTGYLVIKYRERASAERAERAAELARKDIEQEKAEQKLLNAVQQLGSESPQVRIAGVYALADVADTYRGDYRQRVVNILCGYLRTPRGTWETTGEEGGTTSKKVYVSNDGAVESTVLEVLGRHLRKRREKTDHRKAVTQLVEDDQLWCDCTIDLHGACFIEHLNFAGSTFELGTNVCDAVFWSGVDFSGSTFNSIAFKKTRFVGDGNFEHSTFTSGAKFDDSRFKEAARFSHARFFGNVSFERILVKGADFRHTRYVRDVNMSIFGGNAIFTSALFNRTGRHIIQALPLAKEDTGLPPGASRNPLDHEGNLTTRS